MLIPHSTFLLASGTLKLPENGPRLSAKVPLPEVGKVKGTQGGEVFLTVSLRLKTATAWADAGHEIAWFQHRFSAAGPPSLHTVSPLFKNLTVSGHRSEISITGDTFTLVFDQTRGYLKSWTANNTPILVPDPSTGVALMPSFWRPPTDNDQPLSVPYWKRFGVDALTSHVREVCWYWPERVNPHPAPAADDSNSKSGSDSDPEYNSAPPTPTNITRISHLPNGTKTVSLTFTTHFSPPALNWGYLAATTYTITSSGSLTISFHLTPTGPEHHRPTHIPRVGLDLRLSRDLNAVKWLGLGPGESYPDKRAAQKVGVWTAESVGTWGEGAGGMHTPYEVPQEGGNRMGTRWVSVRERGRGGEGRGVRVLAAGVTVGGGSSKCGDKNGRGEGREEGGKRDETGKVEEGAWSDNCEKGGFSFRISRYKDDVVQAAKHPCDLTGQEEDATLLRLDARVAGVGTGACGPGVREDLKVPVEEMRFAFRLEAIGV